jgi:hypothetical protein
MSNLKNKILDQIKDKKVEPKGRWQFLLKDYVIWAVFGLSVIVGSIAFAVIILMLRTRYDFAETSLAVVPYFWIAVLTVFVLIAYLNLSQTKVGYKINPYLWVVISVVASIVLGSLVYTLGWSSHIERGVYRNLPAYQKVVDHKMKGWMNPEAGILIGHVENIEEKGFELFSPDMHIWEVKYEKLSPDFEGKRVRVTGEVKDEDEFEAEEVFMMFGPPKKCEIQKCERKLKPLRTN